MLVPVTTYVVIFANSIICYTLAETEDIVNVVDEITSLLSVIQHIISTAVFLYYNKRNVHIIKMIVKIDDILNISNNRQTYKDSRRHIIIGILLFVIIYLLLDIYDCVITVDISLAHRAILIIIDFERHFEVLCFCIFIKTMKDRLGVVNSLLEQVIKTKHHRHTSNNPVSDLRNQINLLRVHTDTNDTIDNIFRIHALSNSFDLIGKTCNEINKIFEFHIFRALCTTFLYIIITIWTSIYDIKTEETPTSLPSVILTCIFEILSVGLMSYSCEIMLLKRNSTKILVNQLVMDYDLTRQMRIQAKAFMELIEVWPLQIYAYDMFAIDLKLMLKFISVSTTYLIVIIQVSHFF
ncbi:uncharacterized protein LOC112054564 [Bicyclus anynana]|uniref:Gustatory receptor n=1 Tax=Bicyclus anynana TaxID=110368 RepID=A0A6J1NTT6_BICAN|nr:uncharacterized protein LOC112054564 [Bicyclus anynana]